MPGLSLTESLSQRRFYTTKVLKDFEENLSSDHLKTFVFMDVHFERGREREREREGLCCPLWPSTGLTTSRSHDFHGVKV